MSVRSSEASRTRPSALALGLLLAACGDPAPGNPGAPGTPPIAQPADWPAGTVLAINGQPLLASELDPVADVIARVYPEYSRKHLRRLALTNLALEALACRSLHAEARARALETCRSIREQLVAGQGPPDTHPIVELEGRFARLDFDLWLALQDLEPGGWSEPIDLVGRWATVHLLESDGAQPAAHTKYRLELVRVPYVGSEDKYYLDAMEAIGAAVDASVLEIVDPEWREAVPASWQYRMRAKP